MFCFLPTRVKCGLKQTIIRYVTLGSVLYVTDIEVGPVWYQDNGTPVCIECDQDMDYQYTEIKSNG